VQTASKICEHCGEKVFDDTPRGLCPACALETGLGMLQDEFVKTTYTRHPPETKEAGGRSDVLGQLGDYELLEEIGRGGQGVVYKARQKSLNRIVALKVIGLGRWAAKADIERFRLEAEAAARLDHPCIVPIHEIGETDGSCYFSMNLVNGERLDEIVNHKPLTRRRAAEITAKLARTIQHAHECGILHHDIKPGNVLVDKYGEPHLTDFGLASLVERDNTNTGTIAGPLGTPGYMAPEQATGYIGPLTRAVDVYGLGAVFYHLLTGTPPFAGDSTHDSVRRVLVDEPCLPQTYKPEIDRDLRTICLKCLAKDPERRYPSALALAEDLERWLKNKPIRARRTGILTRGKKWARRNRTVAVGVVSLAVLLGTLSIVWKNQLGRLSATNGIAVLPLENLSNDREDAFFVDGLQDDILTKLAKIPGLRVISRASVMQYRDNGNAREIGHALRVSHVLQGSVRKNGAWLHINAQLVDARTNAHIWAEQYDSNLKEVFAIQSAIAEKVAERLHVKISPAEKIAIERPPTVDLSAFDLYSRARNLLLIASYRPSGRENLLRAVDLLNQAVTHDQGFFQAYCQLASAHDLIYFSGFDRTFARRAAAEAAVQTAFRLRPGAGEAHLARAEHLYRCYLDYRGAAAELLLARQTLPNDPRFFELQAYIERRLGLWEESTRDFERAVDLDPRNVVTLEQIATSYELLRRYDEAKLVFDRVLAIEPNDIQSKIERASLEFYSHANTRPLHQLIDSIRTADPSALPNAADAWLICALAERDAEGATEALAALGDNSFDLEFRRHFVEGLIGGMAKDTAKTQSAFIAARIEQENIVRSQPDYAPSISVLGLINAALDHKDEALREGRRALELLPVEKDAINGPRIIEYFAVIAAWVGEKDLACDQLAAAVRYPSFLSYGRLKLLPLWDPLRGYPRFEEIVASLAPKATGEQSKK